MKVLKKIIQVIVLLALLLAVIGFFIPSEVYMERSISIDANAQSVFEEINDVRRINKWSPWQGIDPEGTEYTYTGAETGVGQKMAWKSEHPDVGAGSQEIVAMEDNKKVRTELFFADMDGASYADIILNETDGKTNVTWTYEGDMGSNPFLHYMTLMLEGILGPMYEDGLAQLKARVESKPKYTVSFSINNEEPFSYLAINEKFDMSNQAAIGPRMGEIFGQLIGYIQSNQVMGMGQPMSFYNAVPDSIWNVDVAIPVAMVGEISDENIISGTTNGGKTIKTTHIGDYAKLSETHAQVMEYIKFNELEINGKPYEIYVSDPMEADTAKWETDIYYPIK